MACPTPVRVYVSDCALQAGAEKFNLTPEEVRAEAAHQWADGKGLADMAGALSRYLHYAAGRHGSIPKVSYREVWWFALNDEGAPVLVTIERLNRPMWEDYLAHVARAGGQP